MAPEFVLAVLVVIPEHPFSLIAHFGVRSYHFLIFSIFSKLGIVLGGTIEMHLSFQFDDFFRDRNNNVVRGSDIKTPTFLVQSGVVGDLKIKDSRDNVLNDGYTRLEVDLEGE